MEAMFEDAHVDGTSAVMPGVAREVPADLVDLVDDEDSAPNVVVVNNRCLGVGLSLGPMDARGFGEGLCAGIRILGEEHTRFTQVRGSREEIKPLLLLV